jgi:hypothetical protein
MRHLLIVLTAAVTACGGGHVATPTTPPAQPRTGARVMVLGTYHFGNPNQDVVKSDLDDHRSPRRQAEIADVTARLATFRPTKILIEATDQAALDKTYQAYRSGAAPLRNDETEQLGFRLAKQLDLAGLVAIDHPADMDFDRVMAAAQASHADVFLRAFNDAVQRINEIQKGLHDHSVRDNLRALNDPRRLDQDRDLYLVMARVAHGDDFAGADVLAGWYQRNFRIFASLAAAVTSPDDRVLVIYGGGHAPILRELVAAQPDLVLVEPDYYLGD